MDQRLGEIINQLRLEEAALLENIVRLKTELAAHDADVKRVREALKALGEKPKSKGAKKPAPSKDDVIQAMQSVLSHNAPLDLESLRSEVESHIVETGKSRMGFAMRFKEALAESRFVDHGRGYELSTSIAGEDKASVL